MIFCHARLIVLQWKRKNAFCMFFVELHVTANNIQLFRVHNYFIVNLCQGQQFTYYIPDFEKNNIPTNFHSIHTLHIKDALK